MIIVMMIIIIIIIPSTIGKDKSPQYAPDAAPPPFAVQPPPLHNWQQPEPPVWPSGGPICLSFSFVFPM